MEAAMNNHLVLKTIAKNLPYHDLKNMRFVSTDWTKDLNPVFRERSVSKKLTVSSELSSLLEEEEDCTNADLMAHIPLNVAIGLYTAGNSCIFTEALRQIPDWFQRVSKLSLCVKSTEINQILRYMLHWMPALERLEVSFHEVPILPEVLEIPSVPANFEFSLTAFQIRFLSNSPVTPLNLEFLRHCPNLKSFGVSLFGSPLALLQFLRDWEKQKRLQPRMRFSKICIYIEEIWIDSVELEEPRLVLCRSIVNFINLNQPSHLCLKWIEFDLEFDPNSYKLIQALSTGLGGTSIRQLEILVPVGRERCEQGNGYRPVVYEHTLENARRIPAYSKVIDLVLKLEEGESWEDADEAEVSLPLIVHDFGSVQSLTVEIWIDEYLDKGPIVFPEHLPNVEKLKIKLRNDFLWSFDNLAENISGFTKLQELELQVQRYYCKSTAVTVGMFASVGVLKGLNKLKVVFKEGDIPSEDEMLMELFDGYKPHVQLDLVYRTGSTFKELKLTAKEFEVRMNELEAASPTKAKRSNRRKEMKLSMQSSSLKLE